MMGGLASSRRACSLSHQTLNQLLIVHPSPLFVVVHSCGSYQWWTANSQVVRKIFKPTQLLHDWFDIREKACLKNTCPQPREPIQGKSVIKVAQTLYLELPAISEP